MTKQDERCCKCHHCHEFWYWIEKDGLPEKQYGWCCTVWHDKGQDVVMHLSHIDRPFDTCELFNPKLFEGKWGADE